MDDDRTMCEICMIEYDKTKRLPKKVSCCNKVFCLPCLEEIFRKNSNVLLCPICRKKTDTNPSKLVTDYTVFEDFISCLHCNKSITKGDINISLTTYDFYCKNCGLGDIALYDFFGYLESDLENFCKESLQQNLKQEIENRLKNELDAFFNNVIEKLKTNLLIKIEKEIEQKFHYKITDDYNTFITYIDQLNVIRKSISSFNMNSKEKLNLNELQKQLQYYITNFENIKGAKQKYENISSVLKDSHLFSLNHIISNNDINNFFMNIFETFTADHKEQIETGIEFFDKEKYELMLTINQLKTKINQLNKQITDLHKNNNNSEQKEVNNVNIEVVDILSGCN